MSADSPRRKKRRLHSEDLSATGAFETTQLLMTLFACLCLVGMVFFFGGTQFWASIPFLIPLLLCMILHQSMGLWGMKRGGSSIQLPYGTLCWGALLVYILIRALVNPRVPYQVWTAAYQVGIGLLVYIVFTDLGVKRHTRDRVWFLMMIGAVLQSMWAILLHRNGSNMVLWIPRPESYGMRASGTYICPNHYAHFLQMAGICAFSYFLIPGKSLAMRLLAGFSLLWILPGLILSQSRSGLLGFLVGTGGMLFLRLARKGWKKAVAGFLLSGFAGALILGMIWVFYPPFSERMLSRDTSQNIRFLQFWPDSWNMIQGEGFWGAGPGVFRHAFDQYREHFSNANIFLHYAHNEYLHLIAEYGWIPALLMFGTLGWALCVWLRQAFQLKDEKSAMIPTMQLGLLGSSLAHAIFDFNFHITANILVLVMLVGILQGNSQARSLSKTTSLPLQASRYLAGVTICICVFLLPVSLCLFMGSYAEYQMDAARLRHDPEKQELYAEMMRKWTPIHWRGWVLPAHELRAQATFKRDPVRKQELIDQSRTGYLEALRWNELDPIAHIGLVELSVLEEDYEQALLEMDVLLALSPYDTAIWVRKGILLQELEKYQESLEVFQHARSMRRGIRDEQIDLNIRYLKRKLKSHSAP